MAREGAAMAEQIRSMLPGWLLVAILVLLALVLGVLLIQP